MSKKEMKTSTVPDNGYEAEFMRIAKGHLRRYVESVTDPVPRFGHNAFVCPCCASGAGRNNHYTPAFFLFHADDGTPLFKCHSCDATGDIFTLAGLVNSTENFHERKNIVADFLDVNLAKRTPLSDIPAPDAEVKANATRSQKETLQLKKQASAYISECRKHVQETDYFRKRGLTDETIKRFRLGYDPERRMAVIPFTSCYYMGRNTTVGTDERGSGKHYKPSGLRQPVFNLGALSQDNGPIFLTEAPLDAISLMQAGGTAMALGGTGLSVMKTVLDAYHTRSVFILAFDQDEPGKRLESRAASLLEERNVLYSHIAHPSLIAHKDANAALMNDPVSFQKAVAEEIKRARDLTRAVGRPQAPEKPSLDDAVFAASVSAAAKRAIDRMEKPTQPIHPEGR